MSRQLNLPFIEDDAINRAFTEVKRYLEADNKPDQFPPFGYVLEDVLLDTAQVALTHRLGRKPVGWVVIDRDTNQHIYRSAKSTSEFIFLKATGSVVASIWVF